MQAGILLDDWKLPIFRRHLEAAGMSATEGPPPSPGVMLLLVTVTDVALATITVHAAQRECALFRASPPTVARH